ncbi:helix-turn-helix transcriptional regulator [Streptomyces sp. WAC 06738]|uniref:helix-turn-helix domain-containing protein n=1 Tax=Streptomyces sp. WAC 06738 TaxID=2203210 RepID=UPI0013E0232A|nr:helix-turn-helix transcriptional regulator [Streptomyces sp. WAC 06738]
MASQRSRLLAIDDLDPRVTVSRQAGRSLAKLAPQVQYDSTYLGRAERGEQLPTLHVVAAIDRAVGANGELVRLREDIDRGIDIRFAADGDEAKTGPHEATDFE